MSIVAENKTFRYLVKIDYLNPDNDWVSPDDNLINAYEDEDLYEIDSDTPFETSSGFGLMISHSEWRRL